MEWGVVMSSGAIVLMGISMIIIWGGLMYSVAHYVKSNKE